MSLVAIGSRLRLVVTAEKATEVGPQLRRQKMHSPRHHGRILGPHTGVQDHIQPEQNDGRLIPGST